MPRRKSAKNFEEKTGRFPGFESFEGRRLVARTGLEKFLVEIGHASFLPANVKRPVAADREKPFRRRLIELLALFMLQFHKCFLDDVPGAVAVAQNSSGILEKRPLKASEQCVHLLAIHLSRLDCDALHFFQ